MHIVVHRIVKKKRHGKSVTEKPSMRGMEPARALKQLTIAAIAHCRTHIRTLFP
jgi:hypothetical protein